MIEVKNLAKAFVRQTGSKKLDKAALLAIFKKAKAEQVQAVRDVSFYAPDGAITGLLGANGAGKTTTLRMIAAMLKADQGEVKIDNQVVEHGNFETQRNLGILSDSRGLYPRLSARENIAYYGQLHKMEDAHIEQRITQLGDWLEMQHLLDRRTDGFSQGEKMKTALARALIHDPKNIILDEPTNGLDVMATRSLREFLRWLTTPEGGSKCIVFSTHIMQEVERLCENVVVVAKGKNIATGTVGQLNELAGESNFEDSFVKLAFSVE